MSKKASAKVDWLDFIDLSVNFERLKALIVHLSLHQLFGALVAEVEPDKLLNFWDCEAISRRNNPKTTKRPSSQASQSKLA